MGKHPGPEMKGMPGAYAGDVFVDGRFIRGLELFNQKDFFACHEVIENLWLECPAGDAHRQLYKGVIQAAAALYQFERGILSGAIGLYRSSMKYLDAYRPFALGLNVQKLCQELAACFACTEDWDAVSAVEWRENLVPILEFHYEPA